MLNDIINKMRINRLSDNEEYSTEELMNTIKKHLKTNIDLLEKSYEYEYKEILDNNKLINSFDYIKDNKTGIIDSAFKNSYGKVVNNYAPYGIVGLAIKKDISLYNYASILNLLIQTNNSIIIEPYRKMGTVNILIELLNQIITQISGKNKITINETNELLRDNNNIDLLLFVGYKDDFNTINSKVNKKYYGIGNYELIVDKAIDEKLIEDARYKNVKIIEKNNDEDFYTKFNIENSNYCTAIMTDSKQVASEFVSNVKSSYLLVNVIPTIQDDINIDINDLIYKKSTLIWEDNE